VHANSLRVTIQLTLNIQRVFPLHLACKKDSLTVRGRPYPTLENILLLSIEHLRSSSMS